MVAFTIKVEADLTGTTAFGAARTWTDVTSKVLTIGIGEPIEIENWRGDEWGDVSPSTMDLTIDNTAGTYKPGATGIVPLVSWWRITETISGVSQVLFDGVATSFVEGYAGGKVPVTRIHCVDVLAIFGRRQPLRSMLLEECLLDSPLALHPLGEDEGATSAGDIIGGPAAVVTNSKYGAGSLNFGADTPIVGAQGAVSLSSPDSGSSTTGARGTYLATPNALPASGAFSVEVWFTGPSAHPAAVEYLADLPGGGGQSSSPGEVFLNIQTSGLLSWGVRGSAASPLLNGTGTHDVTGGGTHHAVITLAADGKSATLYLDGAVESTASLGADIAWAKPLTAWSLGIMVNNTQVIFPLSGSLAMFGQYGAALSAARVLAHYNAGANGFAGDSTDARIARLLTYRPDFGSSLDAGVGTMGAQDTTGVTLAEALLACGRAEVGVVYVDGSGQVVLRNRSRLFNPAVALTLNANNGGEVTPDIAPRIDDQDVVNDATISRPLGADQRAFDQTSINLYGTTDGSGERIVASDQAALDIANDIVQNGKTPKVDTPSVTVDIKTMTTVATAQSVLARAPLDRLAVSNLPSTSPTIDGHIQGRHITIAVDRFEVTFNLSPLRLPVMVADDSTLGICDTVNVAAF